MTCVVLGLRCMSHAAETKPTLVFLCFFFLRTTQNHKKRAETVQKQPKENGLLFWLGFLGLDGHDVYGVYADTKAANAVRLNVGINGCSRAGTHETLTNETLCKCRRLIISSTSWGLPLLLALSLSLSPLCDCIFSKWNCSRLKVFHE